MVKRSPRVNRVGQARKHSVRKTLKGGGRKALKTELTVQSEWGIREVSRLEGLDEQFRYKDAVVHLVRTEGEQRVINMTLQRAGNFIRVSSVIH